MEQQSSVFPLQQHRADKIVLVTLLAILFLTPLFFIPSSNVAIDSAKIILLCIGVIVAFLSWIIGRLQEGKVSVPLHYFFIALALIPFSFLVSSIFSGYRSLSFFGHGAEVQTFAFALAAALLSFLVAVTLTSRKAITYSYLVFLATFPIIIIFQLVRLIDPSQTFFGAFTSTTSTLLGSWNDLGIYSGLMALFAFLTIELLPIEKAMRAVLMGVIVVALFLVSLVDFNLIWWVLGITALILFVFNFSVQRSNQAEKTGRPIPLVSLIIVLVSFIFIIAPGNIYGLLSSTPFNIHFLAPLNVNNVEIRPSWSSTFLIARHTPPSRIVTGPGPNRFVNEWNLYKPLDINQTVFWSTDFTVGVSTVATAVVETGLIGLLAWLAFFGFFLYAGIQSIFKKTDPVRRYLLVSSFLTSLYLWIFAALYIPSASIMVLAFFFTGIFFAVLIEGGFVAHRLFNFIGNPRTSFLAVLAFLALVFGSLAFGYVSVKRFIAETYFNQGVALSNNGDFTGATDSLNRAVSLNGMANYYAAFSNLNIAELNNAISGTTSQNTPSVALQNQAKSYITTALSAAQIAVAADPTDYQNWLTLGQVYEVILQLGETDAFPLAQNAYNSAAALDPTNPAIPLVLARLNVENKDDKDAEEDIVKALTLKNNYTDAVFLLSQIQASEGDLPSAIQSVQALASVSPNDPTVYFQLGLLQYDNKDYLNAASSFGQAVALESDYANAKYFLGLADYYSDQTAAAISEFEDLASTNPGNPSVTAILANLQAGKDPFTNVPPPNNNPSKLSKPPLTDEGTSTSTKNSAVTH